MDGFDMIDFDWGDSQVPRTVSGRRMGICIDKIFKKTRSMKNNMKDCLTRLSSAIKK